MFNVLILNINHSGTSQGVAERLKQATYNSSNSQELLLKGGKFVSEGS